MKTLHFDYTQDLSDPNPSSTDQQTFVFFCVSMIGVVLNLIEIFSYSVLFADIRNHNNTVGSQILEAKIIKQRNRVNAITMFGQFVTWYTTSFFFFLPCLSLIKLKKYNYGKWSQLLNKVTYFIYFLWEEQCILHMISTDDTALLTVLLGTPQVIIS